jgi:hypothetical protein
MGIAFESFRNRSRYLRQSVFIGWGTRRRCGGGMQAAAKLANYASYIIPGGRGHPQKFARLVTTG